MDNTQAISQSIIYIEKHLYEPISACDVAKEVSYSYYHFHRYFRAVIGETIGSYIRNRRLSQAAWQLVYSSQKIIDIGTALFFESAESFTRAFKFRYGITPTVYRQNGIYTTIANRKAERIERSSLHFRSEMEPEILMVEPISLLGNRFKTGVSDGESISLWKDFEKSIPTSMRNQNRYEVFEKMEPCHVESFEIEGDTSIFLGFESSIKSNEEHFINKNLPSAKYARFTHIGYVDDLIDTYQYIWSMWFPKSKCRLGIHEDFECYTNRFLGKNNSESQIDIYFSIA